MAYENADGKISRLYVNEAGCNIRLDTHGDRYLVLEQRHRNYGSLYTLLLMAAASRYQVRLRLEDYEPPDPPSDTVQYVVLDLPQS